MGGVITVNAMVDHDGQPASRSDWHADLIDLMNELTPDQAGRVAVIVGEAQASEHEVGRHQGLSEGYNKGYGECMRDWQTSR